MQTVLFLVASAALASSTLVAPTYTYGPQLSGMGKHPYSRSLGGNWTKVPYEVGYAVWFDTDGGDQKYAWRQSDDHTSVAAFIYNSSVPNALSMTINEPASMPNNISGFLYSTAELTYPDSSEKRDSRLSKRSDAWTGPFKQIEWSLARYVDVQLDDSCPFGLNPTFTIEVTDAAGTKNSTSGSQPRFTIPDDLVYPITGSITSDPDVGNATFTFQADQPLMYAIGTGAQAPGVWAYSYIGMYFCIQPEDD